MRRNEMEEVQNGIEFSDISEFDTVATDIKQQESAAKEESKSVIEDILPDEFKGQKPSEIAKQALFYRTQMGKQANELGEVRKLADELIKSQLHKPTEQVVSDEIDIFENPKEAIRRAIEQNPMVQSAALQADNSRKALAQQQLVSKHPDFGQIVQDTGFTEWIGKSKIRQQLFQQANNYDVDAADELFSTYKELRTTRQAQVSDVEKAARGKAMAAAGVDSGGSGETSKKIYRRTDIMKLMTRDRKKYDAMQDEIMLAYSEGRVR
jgi:hypothetical protein